MASSFASHLTAVEALELCSKFLGDVWTQITVDGILFAIHFKQFSNRHYEVELKESVTSGDGVPRKVFITLYGGVWDAVVNFRFVNCGLYISITKRVDCDLGPRLHNSTENHSLGNCPKIFGIFKGGRIEEFVEHESLPVTLLTNDDVIKTISRKFARIHSLNLPIPESSLDYLGSTKNLITGSAANYKLMSDEIPADLMSAYQTTINFDLGSEIEFLRQIQNKLQLTKVFCVNDCNPTSIIIKKAINENSNYEDRITMIDFEYASYSFAAMDLANFLMQRSFSFTDFANPISGIPSPTINEKLIAIRAYLEERKLIGEQVISEEQLLKETLFCGIVKRLFLLGLSIRLMTSFKLNVLMKSTQFIIGEYEREKKEFLAKYSL